MINVISVQKVCYLATKNALTRDDLDSGLHHVVEWTTLTASYNNKSESSDSNPDNHIDLVEDLTQDLTRDQIKILVGYMEGHYIIKQSLLTKNLGSIGLFPTS
jgi:hypothetical protein